MIGENSVYGTKGDSPCRLSDNIVDLFWKPLTISSAGTQHKGSVGSKVQM